MSRARKDDSEGEGDEEGEGEEEEEEDAEAELLEAVDAAEANSSASSHGDHPWKDEPN